MPIFITQGRYNGEAIRNLVNKPEDRTEEVGKLIAAAGGRLIGYYNTMGEHDFLVIAETPTEKDLISALLVAAASGTATDLKTTVAISGGDMKQCLAKAASLAGKYRPAGK